MFGPQGQCNTDVRLPSRIDDAGCWMLDAGCWVLGITKKVYIYGSAAEGVKTSATLIGLCFRSECRLQTADSNTPYGLHIQPPYDAAADGNPNREGSMPLFR